MLHRWVCWPPNTCPSATRPRGQQDVVFQTTGQNLGLYPTFQKIVLRLHGHRHRKVFSLSSRHYFLHLSATYVGPSDIVNLAGFDQINERGQGFQDWVMAIPPMDEINIYHILSKTFYSPQQHVLDRALTPYGCLWPVKTVLWLLSPSHPNRRVLCPTCRSSVQRHPRCTNPMFR